MLPNSQLVQCHIPNIAFSIWSQGSLTTCSSFTEVNLNLALALIGS